MPGINLHYTATNVEFPTLHYSQDLCRTYRNGISLFLPCSGNMTCPSTFLHYRTCCMYCTQIMACYVHDHTTFSIGILKCRSHEISFAYHRPSQRNDHTTFSIGILKCRSHEISFAYRRPSQRNDNTTFSIGILKCRSHEISFVYHAQTIHPNVMIPLTCPACSLQLL